MDTNASEAVTHSNTPESVVQRQLDANNARDMDALMAPTPVTLSCSSILRSGWPRAQRRSANVRPSD